MQAAGLKSAALRKLAFKAARRQQSTCTRAAKTSVIRQVHHDLATKQRSAVEVVQRYLEQIGKADGVVNSFITVEQDRALQQVSNCGHGRVCDW